MTKNERILKSLAKTLERLLKLQSRTDKIGLGREAALVLPNVAEHVRALSPHVEKLLEEIIQGSREPAFRWLNEMLGYQLGKNATPEAMRGLILEVTQTVNAWRGNDTDKLVKIEGKLLDIKLLASIGQPMMELLIEDPTYSIDGEPVQADDLHFTMQAFAPRDIAWPPGDDQSQSDQVAEQTAVQPDGEPSTFARLSEQHLDQQAPSLQGGTRVAHVASVGLCLGDPRLPYLPERYFSLVEEDRRSGDGLLKAD